MATSEAVRLGVEQARINKNVAELISNLEARPAETRELVAAKTKMLRIFGLLPELGGEWAQNYLDLAKELAVRPRAIRVYAVGGMLLPENPFRVHYKFEKRFYSDLDLIFAVDKVSESLSGAKALIAVLKRLDRAQEFRQLEELERDRSAMALEAVQKEAGVTNSRAKEMVNDWNLGGGSKREKEMKSSIEGAFRSRPDFRRLAALLAIKRKFDGRITKSLEAKGVEDAEYCIDVLDIGCSFLEGDKDSASYKLIGVAVRSDA